MVVLVNNHVLFPNAANWKHRPEWSRQWENEIGTAVTGAETRNALRTQPRITLAFTITPRSVVEQTEFDDRIRAASKSGFACAPYHGRGAILNDDAWATDVSITVKAGRTWTVGDYLFLRAADESYEVRLLTAVNLAAGIWTLEFADELTGDHRAGSFAWPLIFGEFKPAEMAARSPRTGPARITIRELISPATAALGAVVPPVGTGIGYMKIGSTFEVA